MRTLTPSADLASVPPASIAAKASSCGRRRPVFRALPFIMLACGLLLSLPARTQFAQQGPKLVGTGVLGPGAVQGWSVSLSGDGSTAIIGGPDDNSGAYPGPGQTGGAAWVFARTRGMWSQQLKLVGSGGALSEPEVSQGWSVSLSSDGDNAVVGAPGADFSNGAAWVFTRSDGTWTQQAKLSSTAFVEARAGSSVSLSADGNTAIVGAFTAESSTPVGICNCGATFVFTRSGGVWTRQAELIGTFDILTEGGPQQGASVSLSADGNTAIIGRNFFFNNNIGAAWVFTRAGGVWTQQAKLVGTGAMGSPQQGMSVSLSADGNTAIVGGPGDSGGVGAAWVFARSGGNWTQQAKLVGAGAVGNAGQGTSVALSGDGNTAIVGGASDDNGAGAAWVFTREEGVWNEQILVGSGAVGAAEQGYSVALSVDASTAIVAGPSDNNGAGATWVFSEFVFPGTPGKANCHGQRTSAITRRYGGLNAAAAALGFATVSALQDAIMAFCGD